MKCQCKYTQRLCAENPNTTSKTAIPCILHYPTDGFSCLGEEQFKVNAKNVTLLRFQVAARRKTVS